jgi:hypothetical protein
MKTEQVKATTEIKSNIEVGSTVVREIDTSLRLIGSSCKLASRCLAIWGMVLRTNWHLHFCFF